MKFKISIITINYNNVEGLRKTIDSITCQSNKSFEYIVIDGGSLDGSKEVIIINEKHITYWVSEKDAGIYNAMNKGIKASSGDFIIFMNSGDLLYNQTVIQDILENLNGQDDIVYGDALLRNESNKWEVVKKHPKILNFSYFYKDTLCQQACIIKRSLFDTIFLFNEDYKIGADWEFFIYAIYIAKVKTRKIDFLITTYDTRGISGSSEFKKIAAQERRQTLEKYFPLFVEDYKMLNRHGSDRSKQLLQIEKSVFFRKVISVVFKFVLLFIPKEK